MLSSLFSTQRRLRKAEIPVLAQVASQSSGDVVPVHADCYGGVVRTGSALVAVER